MTEKEQTDTTGRDLNLAMWVEKKLREFLQKTKQYELRDLHSLVIREVEKPLISLMLEQVKGNQMRAAQRLGMNRNTLRKKIKELKISIPKYTSKESE